MNAARHLQSRYADLTAQQRQVADHMLAHPFEAATLAIDAMAERCDVSVATMNRYARALGYPGYSALRKDWQQVLHGAAPPVDKLQQQRTQATQPAQRLQAALEDGVEQLRSAAALLHADTPQQVAQLLAHAPRVGVLGSDVSAYLASYFVSYASLFRGGVDAISGLGGAGEAQRRVLALQQGDLLLAISLPRYSTLTVELCALARERGVWVVAITDSPASPVAPHAHHVLLAPSQHAVLPAGGMGVLGLLEGLCALIAAQSPRSREELLELALGATRFHTDALPRRPRS